LRVYFLYEWLTFRDSLSDDAPIEFKGRKKTDKNEKNRTIIKIIIDSHY
jgi:hypothetical protein